jgi:hypothetical protein
MIALHSAMSPVTDAGSSGTTSVAEASRIQLLPLVIRVMASLLAMAPEMRDSPKAVASATFLMVAIVYEKSSEMNDLWQGCEAFFRRIEEERCFIKNMWRRWHVHDMKRANVSQFSGTMLSKPYRRGYSLKHSFFAEGVSRQEFTIHDTLPNESSLRT